MTQPDAERAIVVCSRCGTPQYARVETFECLICSHTRCIVSNPDTLIAAYYETAIRETAVIQAAMFYLRNRMEGNATSVELAGRRAGVSRWSVYRGLSKLEQIITRRAASANQQENSNEPH